MTEPTKYKAGDSKESGERCDHEYMCPNCVTPWRCNGPHLRDECVKCGDPGPLLPTPPPAPEPAKAKDCRCASVMDGRGGMCPAHPPEPAPGPAKGGEARVEYAGETPNCVASLREKSVAEFVTGLINERAQLRKANEELEDKLAHTQFEVDGMANTLARFAIDKIGLIQPTEWDDRDLYRGIEMRFNKLKKANEELVAERNALREGLREARDLLARYNRHTSLIDQQEVLRSVQMLPSDHDALMARFDDLLAGEDALTNGGDDGR
jgi:hypothetical protein